MGEKEAEKIRSDYMDLFSKRKAADHRPYVFSREEAELSLKKTKFLIFAY
ncbi:MAG: hypothetical protein ACPL09_02350 [Candidatus Methanodesulfokora sp.]|jgi:Txe/YoeB family toxin of Txe-Axe toxin-antitoxin module